MTSPPPPPTHTHTTQPQDFDKDIDAVIHGAKSWDKAALMDALLDLKLKPWKKGHVSPVDCSKFPAGNCTTIFNPTSPVGSVGTIQSFTVPVKGTYRIEVWGAQGGRVETGNDGLFGGLGARMRGDFSLDPGTVLSVLVGQQGTSNFGTEFSANSGGGGGSFVVRSENNMPLIIAGGGGGIRNEAGVNGGPGLITTTAGNCTLTPGGVPGSDGKGGGVLNSWGSGGGGFIGNGTDDTPHGFGGQAFLAGGNGGIKDGNNCGDLPNPGGFGGGGAGNGCSGGGGGGGYSGGPGCNGAGGGGSFNIGMNPSNNPGQRSGAGLVTITFIP